MHARTLALATFTALLGGCGLVHFEAASPSPSAAGAPASDTENAAPKDSPPAEPAMSAAERASLEEACGGDYARYRNGWAAIREELAPEIAALAKLEGASFQERAWRTFSIWRKMEERSIAENVQLLKSKGAFSALGVMGLPTEIVQAHLAAVGPGPAAVRERTFLQRLAIADVVVGVNIFGHGGVDPTEGDVGLALFCDAIGRAPSLSPELQQKVHARSLRSRTGIAVKWSDAAAEEPAYAVGADTLIPDAASQKLLAFPGYTVSKVTSEDGAVTVEVTKTHDSTEITACAETNSIRITSFGASRDPACSSTPTVHEVVIVVRFSAWPEGLAAQPGDEIWFQARTLERVGKPKEHRTAKKISYGQKAKAEGELLGGLKRGDHTLFRTY